MTRATFFSAEDRISGFELRGHTGLASEGEDILCAAVTSAVRLTECMLNTVMGISAEFSVKPNGAVISCKLPSGLSPTAEELSQTALASLMVYLTELKEEYPEYLDIVEK